MIRLFAPLLLVCVSASSVDDAAFNFLVMGDWGGQGSAPYTTSAEIATAAGMGKLSGERGSSFSLALGDNFYSSGITTDETDMRFEHTFENVFTSSNLMADDFFRVLLGNHDHYGNVSAQVQYSNHSKRWRMDDLYWSFEETGPAYTGSAADGLAASNTAATSTSVKIVMIDTVTLAGVGHAKDEVTGEYFTPDGDALPGPADQEVADAQWTWIEAQMEAASDADYLIVAGHYPVYSICEHGPTSTLVDQLKPLLEKYNATAYVNGHDHCQQQIDVNGVAYHTIGSAHANDPSTAHKSKIPSGSLQFHIGNEDQGGFGVVTVTGAGLVVEHMAGNGTVVYTAPAIAPRSAVRVAPAVAKKEKKEKMEVTIRDDLKVDHTLSPCSGSDCKDCGIGIAACAAACVVSFPEGCIGCLTAYPGCCKCGSEHFHYDCSYC